ncbi:MAG: hypothetical protein KAU95_00340 [Candidatus Aenigmarchaeota archaeon]|nr:hypothetical protein [Candidatus Aenigmarchaeota archaeon]
MDYKEILKPTRRKILLTIIFVLVLPNFSYWSCCLSQPCPVEYKVHFGLDGLLLQTMGGPKCGEFTYFYFWPLSILIAYLISGLLTNYLSKNEVILIGIMAIILLLLIEILFRFPLLMS